MHYLNFLYPALLATSLASGAEALRSGQKIKLSNVQSLTLRKDLKTSHRRVPAVPQLKCIGGSAKGLYDVDVMRCKNSGYDYNEQDIQWTCTASLPEEFKLGSTDVICEGYDSADDPYVLKGSCGVEYKLILTDKGERKYGKKKPWAGDDDGGNHPKTTGENVAAAIFWMIFIAVLLWIAYNAFQGWAERPAGAGGNRPGWGGGGGGGWGGDNDDPPPPYDYRAAPKQNYGSANPQQQTWRPGFWSGAMGGAAAGYAAGRYGNSTRGGGSSRDNGEGSSRSSSGSSSYSAPRHESTGFGSTSRR